MYCAFGIAYDDAGDYERAIYSHEKSLLLAEQCGDYNRRHRAQLNMGYIYGARLGLVVKAIELLSRAVQLEGGGEVISIAHEHLADNYEVNGEWRKALEHRIKALDAVPQEQLLVLARHLAQLAYNKAMQGELTIAHEHMTNAWQSIIGVKIPLLSTPACI